MIFSDKQTEALKAPLDRLHVKQREAWKNGPKLDYIEGWHAIAEANRIFGFDGWERRTLDMKEARPPELIKNRDGKEQWHVGYTCRVRIIVHRMLEQEGGRPAMVRTVREGTGYGSGIARDLGDAIESAVKESETDAMKRALMTFGNQFGLALYDQAKANVTDTYAEERDDLIRLIKAAPTKAVLEELGVRLKAFKDEAPENYQRQVGRAYNTKVATYEGAGAH